MHRKDNDIVITGDDLAKAGRVIRIVGYSLFFVMLLQRRERPINE